MALLVVLLSNYLIFLFPLVIAVLFTRRQSLLGIQAVISGLLSWTISMLIKNLYYIPRPYILNHTSSVLGVWMDGSFPSGHTALAFSISLIILFRHRRLGLFCLFCTGLVALGRIVGGIHNIYDVSGGLLIGLLSAILTRKITNSYQNRSFKG